MGKYVAKNGKVFEFDSNFLMSKDQAFKDMAAARFEEMSLNDGRATPMEVQGFDPATATPNAAVGALMKFGNAASLNSSDEIGSALNAAFTTGGDFMSRYNQNQKDFAEQMQLYENANPKTAALAEVGGALASAVPLGLAGAAKLGAKGLSQTGVGAGLIASGEGAVAGFMGGDTLEDRAGDAAIGAGLGFVAGTAGAKLLEETFRVLGGGVELAKRKLKDTPQDEVRRAIAKAAKADGLDADEALKMLDDLGPNATLMDLGANFQSEAFRAKAGFGEGKAKIGGFLDERQAGARARVLSAAEEAVGEKAGRLSTTTARLEEEMSTQAAPFYQMAYDTPFYMDDHKGLKSFLERHPSVAKAYRQAKLTVKDELGPESLSPVMRLDHTGRNLFDMALKAERGSNSRRQKQALRRELNGLLEEAVPDLAAARQIWGKGEEQKKAAELGEDIFKTKPRQIADDLEFMTEPEKVFYRRGALEAIEDKLDLIGRNRDASSAVDAYGSDAAKKRITAAFDNPGPLLKQMKAEHEMVKTRNAVSGNSLTTERNTTLASIDNAVDMTRVGAGVAGGGNLLTQAVAVLQGIGKIADPKLSQEAVAQMADVMVSNGLSRQQLQDMMSNEEVIKALGPLRPVFEERVLGAMSGAVRGLTRGAQGVSQGALAE
jgi:hypothetical protein